MGLFGLGKSKKNKKIKDNDLYNQIFIYGCEQLKDYKRLKKYVDAIFPPTKSAMVEYLLNEEFDKLKALENDSKITRQLLEGAEVDLKYFLERQTQQYAPFRIMTIFQNDLKDDPVYDSCSDIGVTIIVICRFFIEFLRRISAQKINTSIVGSVYSIELVSLLTTLYQCRHTLIHYLSEYDRANLSRTQRESTLGSVLEDCANDECLDGLGIPFSRNQQFDCVGYFIENVNNGNIRE